MHDSSVASVRRKFEDGIWSMTTESLGNRVIRYVEKMNKYAPFSVRGHFMRGFVCCVAKKGFNFEHLMDQLKKYPKKIVDPGDNERLAREAINTIYNYRCLEEEQVYLG